MAERDVTALIRRARAGELDAQLRLGRLYLDGRGHLPADPVAAYLWLDKAAQQGCADAALLIGRRVPAAAIADARRARVYYALAAAAGSNHARKVLAEWLLTGAAGEIDVERALALIEAAALAGDVGAQLRLAHCLDRGVGCTGDEAHALHWYEIAARNGSLAAQHALANHYWAQRDVKGRHWLKQLAERGDDRARVRLGEWLIESGQPRDAALWLAPVADRGDPAAQFAYGMLFIRSRGASESGVPRSHKRGASWLGRAARQGHAQAAFELSVLYTRRSFSLRDAWTARRFLEDAAALGHVEAQFRLGRAYLRQGETRDDDVTAAQWLARAARGGHAEATALLGSFCRATSTTAEPDPRRTAGIRAIATVDLPLALRLELADAFPLSCDEALMLDPIAADRGECLLMQLSDARPARRIVLIETAAQRALLDRAKRLAAVEPPRAGDVPRTLRERRRALAHACRRLALDPALFGLPATRT